MSHRKLINETQPFGQVISHNSMGGTPIDSSASSKNMGSTTAVPNHGFMHPASAANKNPGAQAQACAHNENPFFWTGHPRK